VAQRTHDEVIERLQEEFKRRIKTHTVLPSADAAMHSAHCSHQNKSTCAKSMAGKRSPPAYRSAN
jgi:transposase-like protein